MADGCAELVFHYKGVFEEIDAHGEHISGPLSLLHAQGRAHRRFITDTAFGIFGAYLFPFAIPHAVRAPATDVCGRLLDLQTLFGSAGREIEARVMAAPHNAARMALVSRFLETQLLHKRVRDAAVFRSIVQLLAEGGTRPVARLAAGAHLSVRQFERKVKEHAGLSPKLLSRIARFQAAATLAVGEAPQSLTEIGYNCGYYDQSHFIRDFKEFSGYQPHEFFAGTAEGTDYRSG